MGNECFKIKCKHLCDHEYTHSYFHKLSSKEARKEEDRMVLQLCPDCVSKSFSELNFNETKKRGGYRPGSGRPTALGQGKTTTIRIPQKFKEKVKNYVKELAKKES